MIEYGENTGVEKIRLTSKDIVLDNVDKIGNIFPQVITETMDSEGNLKRSIDFDKLKDILSQDIVEGKETYDFTWVGKREAIAEAGRPTTKTLRPDLEESVDFENTENIFITGDNLEVLKILQESYLNKIDVIYIDPPYNTGSDFVYSDKFEMSQKDFDKATNSVDETGKRLIKNEKTNARYHSNWLNMMYPRLVLARNLLKENGVIFISIDDNEQANLKNICDEIFGEKNFIGMFTVNSTPNARDYGHIGKMHEYVLFYSKNIERCKTNYLPDKEKNFKYSDDLGGFNIHPLYNSNEAFHINNRPNLYYPFYLNPQNVDSDFYEISLEKHDNWIEVYPPVSIKNRVQFVWRWGREKSFQNLNKEIVGYKVGDEYRIVQKMRNTTKVIRSILSDKTYTTRKGTSEVEKLFGKKVFDFPKPVNLIKTLLKVGTDKDSLILDFFAGSGTTASATMQLNSEDLGNRKFIICTLDEVINEELKIDGKLYSTIDQLSRERVKKSADKICNENPLQAENFDLGFKTFRVDSSNYKNVIQIPEILVQEDLFDAVTNVKSNRSSLDLLYQVMLNWGLELSLKIVNEEFNGANIYNVDNNSLVACFDDNITEETIREIAGKEPLRAVFKDSSFDRSASKINLLQIFKEMSPLTKVKVI